ncbi:MAG: heavy metal translocating P-type ATPase [Lachnospiraceae bacterium]|nr:heavy metal translocating P-type ATPase [Lachnospiraceae bacterium]
MRQYSVTGMSCAACVARVEKAVSQVPGVDTCSVSLLTNSMGVEGTAADAAIIRAVENAGYGAKAKNRSANAATRQTAEEDALADKETPVLRRRLIASVAVLIPLLYLSMGHMLWAWPLPRFFDDNHVAMGLVQLVLTGLIMVINQKFFISGFKSLIHRAPNMDALVALGSSAAFLWSLYVLFAMTRAASDGNSEAVMAYMMDFYFESAATILTLITVGKMLEARSKGRTTDALKGLMRLAPKTATVVKDGVETVLPIDRVNTGDVFVVRPGENIPVDGIVIDGSGAVNESALTGESIPVDKAAGDGVSAATTNESGFLTCQATRVGEDTTLSQIIRMVSDAAATKAPIAKIADKVSGFFVPAVIVIALVTFAVWMFLGEPMGTALTRAVAVLVISCPCALGLATPVAIMVGNGMGAKNGILFKTAVSLEETGKAGIVVLDKTGTITAGQPQVTDILPADGFSEEDLLGVALSLERKSEHPLAKAILREAEEQGIKAEEVTDFKALPGNGLEASRGALKVSGGNLLFIRRTVEVPDVITAKADVLSEEGKTPLFFAADGKLMGIIAVADVIKEDSPNAIRELKALGMKVIMLTGDNERTAKAIGKAAGVDEVIAGVLPDGKEAEVRALQEKAKVIMVGDGINDAPALTRADIGIAIGAGADVAIDAADVVLMKNRLLDVPAAIRLSRKTLKNIHQNLFWAFFYNVIGIPLAAGVFIPFTGWQLNPMFAAAAMSLSSFFVVTNALRLNLFRIYGKEGGETADMEKENGTAPNENVRDRILTIEGMMCEHCEKTVKNALENIDGVKSAVVSHEKNQAIVHLSKEIPDETLSNAVEAKDYRVVGIS